MAEPTLAELAKRLEAVEKQLAEQAAAPVANLDWLKVIGMFDAEPEFVRQVIAEGEAIREAERKAAREKGGRMILLDTDHISVLEVPSSDRRTRLVARLAQAAASGEVIGTTIVTVEEQMRGWLASIAKERQPRGQIKGYRELARLFGFFQAFHLALFDEAAADAFERFGSIRIGSMDKKIASIALANNALLLTANRRDYEQIPGLRFENWMDPPAAPSPPTP